MNKFLSRRTVIIAIACFIWAIVFALDLIPELRGGWGWRWPRQLPGDFARLIPLVLTLIVYLIGAGQLLKRRSPAGLIAWSIVGAVALTLAGLFVRSDPLTELLLRTVDGRPTGWHYALGNIQNLDQTLRAWPDFMLQSMVFSQHMRLSPPGLVIVYYDTAQVLNQLPGLASALSQPLRDVLCSNIRLMNYTDPMLASAWLGILTPLGGGLTTIALYRLGQRLFNEAAARWSLIWWPLVPGLLMFSPTPNVVYPLLTTLIIALVVEGLFRNQIAWFFAAGSIASWLTYLTLSIAPLFILIGLFAIGIYWASKQWMSAFPIESLALRRWLVLALAFTLGLSMVWIIYTATSGVSIGSILGIIADQQLALDRPYLPWLFLHLNDVFMFTGWPLSLLAGLGVIGIIRQLRQKEPVPIGALFSLALVITLAVFDLSGVLRGESGRVLLFLSPLMLLSAAQTLTAEKTPSTSRAGWTLTVVQSILLLIMIASLRVIETDLTPSPSSPPAVTNESAAIDQPSSTVFADSIRLDGFSGQPKSLTGADGRLQPMLALGLDWASIKPVKVPYAMSIVMQDAVGASTTVTQPFSGKYPFTCWQPGSGDIHDRIFIPWFDGEAGQQKSIELALIDQQTGKLIDALMPDGSRSDRIELGPFSLEPRSALTVEISSPIDGSTISGKVTVFGTAVMRNLDHYQLEYGLGWEPGGWKPIGSANTHEVTDAILARWDTTKLKNNPYTLRLTTFNQDGGFVEARIQITIQNPAGP